MNARDKGLSVVLLSVFVSGMICVSAGFPGETTRIVGTYTNMQYNNEGGDLVGEELRIVSTNKGYQGTLQFAEGEPSRLILVDIRVDTNRVSFIIPENSQYAGEFSGTITGAILRGKFTFRSGGSEVVALKKGKSYWD